MDYEKLIYVCLAIGLILLTVKGPIFLQSRKAKGRRITELDGIFPSGADDQGRFLIYFWSPSCGMCRSTTSIINALMEERAEVLSLNVLDHMELARELGIMGTPAFVLLDRQVVEKLVFGTRNRRQLLQMLAD